MSRVDACASPRADRAARDELAFLHGRGDDASAQALRVDRRRRASRAPSRTDVNLRDVHARVADDRSRREIPCGDEDRPRVVGGTQHGQREQDAQRAREQHHDMPGRDPGAELPPGTTHHRALRGPHRHPIPTRSASVAEGMEAESMRFSRNNLILCPMRSSSVADRLRLRQRGSAAPTNVVGSSRSPAEPGCVAGRVRRRGRRP